MNAIVKQSITKSATRQFLGKNSTRLVTASLVATFLILSGCSSKPYTSTNSVTGSGSGSTSGNSTSGSSSGSTTSGTTYTGGNAQGNMPVPSFYPAASFLPSISGTGSYTTLYSNTIMPTDNLLQVLIQADTAGQVVLPDGTYSNFQAIYDCAAYTVEVLVDGVVRDSRRTVPLNVVGSGGCKDYDGKANGYDWQIMDFSALMTPGHSNYIQIRIKNDEYDFYCKNWRACQGLTPGSTLYTQNLCNGYPATVKPYVCPMKSIYQNHTVRSKLQVQTSLSVLYH
jgi:hypothetical protein